MQPCILREPRRRSIRLRDHDYSTPGAYFITACTQNRLLLFGRVVNGKTAANRYGVAVENCWTKLPDHYDNVALDAFILMPNHVHGVIIIEDEPTGVGFVSPANLAVTTDANATDVGAGLKPALPAEVVSRPQGLPEIVRAFKPGFPILGVFRLKGQPNRDGSIIVRSCKATQSPVYPMRDAIAVVEHPSCPSSSSSCPLPVG